MKKVGIVSSIPIPTGTGSLHEKLTKPITDAGHSIAAMKNAGGDYNAKSKRKMRRAVKDLLDADSFDLIISVGGLVAARAVSDAIAATDNVGFLVCVGRAPNEGSSLWDNDLFMGGINLDTPSQNPLRAAYLIQQNSGTVKSVTDICLYYNDKSHMAEKEANEWRFSGGLVKKSSVDHTANDTAIRAAINADFASLPSGTKAIIVSSDPFFAAKASILTDEFKSMPTCYPNSRFSPPTGSFSYGVDIGKAYNELGKKAVSYLATPKQMGLDTLIPDTVSPLVGSAPSSAIDE
jgi:hypothetical protein